MLSPTPHVANPAGEPFPSTAERSSVDLSLSVLGVIPNSVTKNSSTCSLTIERERAISIIQGICAWLRATAWMGLHLITHDHRHLLRPGCRALTMRSQEALIQTTQIFARVTVKIAGINLYPTEVIKRVEGFAARQMFDLGHRRFE